MREPSLRPERSASANSATSAFFMRTKFYPKGVFCQPEVHDSLSRLKMEIEIWMEQNDNRFVLSMFCEIDHLSRIFRVAFFFKNFKAQIANRVIQ